MCMITVDILHAQTDTTLTPQTDSMLVPPTNNVRSIGQNKFAVFGNAEAVYHTTKGVSEFTDVNFKPIFLWKISDKLFAEAEIEIETGDGAPDLGLEYANMCYMVNPYLILHAGRFLPKFGAYRGRMGEAFINRFATDPTGFGDGGIGAMNETGIGAEGALPIGDIKLLYDFYISNGPQLLTDPENAGQFEYEAYTTNNKHTAVGGRVGILPLSNGNLEIGYSMLNKSKTGDAGTPYENTGLNMQAIDLNYFHTIPGIKSTIRLIGELKYQKVDNVSYYKEDSTKYSFNNKATAYYTCLAIRPSLADDKFVRNLELAGRYSFFNRPTDAPWGGDNISQFELALDYWLKWNCVVKLSLIKQKSNPEEFFAQFVFGF